MVNHSCDFLSDLQSRQAGVAKGSFNTAYACDDRLSSKQEVA